MRIDPSQIGDPLRQLGGGAADAARGQDAQVQAAAVTPEAEYESLDQLLLKRLRVSGNEEAAAVAISFFDVQQLAIRTQELMGGNSAAAKAAHGELARDRLRDLLGG